ncbi:chemotaxis protein methyltransferase [Bordetella ansorpii]|uniref:Chemotaxis protein methyltransferase n=1 Tax=Bordetella ansorpii TaxID=288768 RepID=A0A157SSC9_9BORD|nr:CheR family methyltransferase [Bordetella ansorpii]SAI73211.1 chemotaxis protein methyltransferase [Bordetella ansorpii]
MQTISDQEFGQFQRFIFEAAGINLSPAKKALVTGRLSKRLHACGTQTYGAYFALLKSGGHAEEVQTAIDLLTTNETYFFREPRHFELLASAFGGDNAQRRGPQPVRAWSAASSSGEEAYSIAMVLKDCLRGGAFEVIGTDISTRMLQRARTGHYPEQRTRQIPQEYLKRYCLKGRGAQEGTLLVDRGVREHVHFTHANLNADLPELGQFDVAFLRNVLIYFNGETKRQVVERVLSRIKPGGWLYIGHSESLHGLALPVQQVMPSVYRKP